MMYRFLMKLPIIGDVIIMTFKKQNAPAGKCSVTGTLLSKALGINLLGDVVRMTKGRDNEIYLYFSNPHHCMRFYDRISLFDYYGGFEIDEDLGIYMIYCDMDNFILTITEMLDLKSDY